jgi:N-acetyldiaminopimelate deacetylase
MTGEDFGFFTTLYPGLLFWLGSGCSYPLHSDKFLPRDECLEIGVKIMSAFLTTE